MNIESKLELKKMKDHLKWLSSKINQLNLLIKEYYFLPNDDSLFVETKDLLQSTLETCKIQKSRLILEIKHLEK